MVRAETSYGASALVLMLLALGGASAALAESVTNKPCVDVTSDEPYGFPLKVECPFSVDSKLLDEAVDIAKGKFPASITKARAGHMSHPFWSPGVVFSYEPYRTNHQSVSAFLRVYFDEREEKRMPGGAVCGRDLVKISSAALRPSLSFRTNDVFSVNGRDVVAHVRCVKEEKEDRDGSIHITVEDVPMKKQFRSEIQSLLECIDSDKFLDAGYNNEIKSILGRVYPGEDEKEIIPETIAEKAFANLESEETVVLDDGEEVIVEMISYEGDMLTRGRWTRPLQNSFVRYCVNTGVIEVRNFDRKHAASQSGFARLDGIWVKVSESSVCF